MRKLLTTIIELPLFGKKTPKVPNGPREKKRSTDSTCSSSPKHPPSPLLNGEACSLDVRICGGLSDFEDDVSIGDLGKCGGFSPSKLKSFSRSRLSKSLEEVLSDKGALGYFIQYLDARDAVALIKFWLEVESFTSASSIRIRNSEDGKDFSDFKITREDLEASSDNNDEVNEVTCKRKPVLAFSDINCDDTSKQSNKRSDNLECSKSEVNESQSKNGFNEIQTLKVTPPVCDNDSSCLDNSITCVNQNSDVIHEPKFTSQDSRSISNSEGTSHKKVTFSSPSRAVKLIQDTLEDAVRIFRKYFVQNAPYRILIDESVRNQMIEAICKDNGVVEADCFSECQSIVFHTMEKDYFNDFLVSDFHCKHQIDVLTSGNVTLADILYNETAVFYFMEFMEQEGNRCLIEFWLAAINFQQHLKDKKSYDPEEAQKDAIILYDKYFSLQATSSLGFTDKIRFEIEENICREGGPLPDCFQKPVNIVLYVLEKNYFPTFLTSQLFYKYLSELVNTIQDGSSLFSLNRKHGSESGSEISVSEKNSLLAMEDPAPPRKIIRNVDGKDLVIDPMYMNDPDSLWKRRYRSGLSFGKINEMGRYKTDIEPEPDKKEESRITKVMKKLVNMEEDKAKEELAWQIAEMIVKDITNVTMPQNEMSS